MENFQYRSALQVVTCQELCRAMVIHASDPPVWCERREQCNLKRQEGIAQEVAVRYSVSINQKSTNCSARNRSHGSKVAALYCLPFNVPNGFDRPTPGNKRRVLGVRVCM